MTKGTKQILLYAGIGILLAMILFKTWKTFLLPFLKTWEQFSPTPYWDVKQWSWGFGTRVPGSGNDPAVVPTGTITRDQAAAAAVKHAEIDKAYLTPLLTRSLNSRQWAAYLSFSYNEGPGNADNLIANINAGDWSALQTQWNKYILVNGSPSQNQIDRRAAEWNLFIS